MGEFPNELIKELTISPAMVSFGNLSDALKTLDETIELHNHAIAKYGDRLGILLRGTGTAPPNVADEEGGEEFPQSNGNEDAAAASATSRKEAFFQSRGAGGNGRGGRSEGDDQGWIVFESEDYTLKVASGSSASVNSKQASVLFKIVEALKSKVATLEAARKFMSELPSQGFRAEQRFVVVFRDGIPRQIIATNESSTQQRRYRYAENFEVEILT